MALAMALDRVNGAYTRRFWTLTRPNLRDSNSSDTSDSGDAAEYFGCPFLRNQEKFLVYVVSS